MPCVSGDALRRHRREPFSANQQKTMFGINLGSHLQMYGDTLWVTGKWNQGSQSNEFTHEHTH